MNDSPPQRLQSHISFAIREFLSHFNNTVLDISQKGIAQRGLPVLKTIQQCFA